MTDNIMSPFHVREDLGSLLVLLAPGFTELGSDDTSTNMLGLDWLVRVT